MELSSKMLLPWLCLLLSVPFSLGFDLVEVSPSPTRVPAGQDIRLLCRSDGYFEFCIWRHRSSVCEFEWKRASGTVEMMRCADKMKAKISFSGDYERHECALNVSSVSAWSDAGQWSCEVEAYIIGPARGAIRKGVINVVVTKSEEQKETTPEAAHNSTESSDSSSLHEEVPAEDAATAAEEVYHHDNDAEVSHYDYHDHNEHFEEEDHSDYHDSDLNATLSDSDHELMTNLSSAINTKYMDLESSPLPAAAIAVGCLVLVLAVVVGVVVWAYRRRTGKDYDPAVTASAVASDGEDGDLEVRVELKGVEDKFVNDHSDEKMRYSGSRSYSFDASAKVVG